MKICSNCNVEKALSEFFKSSNHKDGYDGRCKECKTIINRQSYVRNKDEIKLKMIKRTYGIEPEDYLKMIDDGCEACGSYDDLCVDHDHGCCEGKKSCGKCVRGILCKRCNMAEGLFKNNPKTVKKLLKYMEKHDTIKKTKDFINE